MSINVIIVAALALIVLIVLAVIFTGRLKIFSEGLQSCASKQGDCKTKAECQQSNGAVITQTECDNKTPPEVCCVQVLNT